MQNHTIASITKSVAHSKHGMVATKDQLSTRAGLSMLENGGNAIDAAVAACLAVGVVEPESSGIGGGGYMVFQVRDEGGVIGFPMKGPLNAKPNMYKLSGSSSVGSFGWAGVENDENIHGYRSIAVPGSVAGLLEAHKSYGVLPLKEVVTPAVKLAREGFSPEWFTLYKLGSLTEMLLRYKELGNTFMPNGSLPYGNIDSPYLLKQQNLAEVLEIIGREGTNAFYRGDITKSIVRDIQENGGILSMEDFEQYRPSRWEHGLEFKYRGKIIRVPPYASAGITSGMTLKMLDRFDIKAMGHNSVDMLHTYISAARLAYADRFQYIADPEHADVPWNGLMSDAYSEKRASSIEPNQIQNIKPGNPWVEEGRSPEHVLESSAPSPDSGTTHLTVMDSEGNAVSITNTIMSGFGSGIIPRGTGVVMNNGMMWYDPIPGRVNSIAPGKYPLNNMTPALVLGTDGVEMALGASGGRRITNCVTSLLVKMIDFNMDPQSAIDSPRVDCSSQFTDVDSGLSQNIISQLKNKGHNVRVLGADNSQTGLAKFASPVAIKREKDGFFGGVDTFHAAYAAGPS